jgi:hypothetical protein
MAKNADYTKHQVALKEIDVRNCCIWSLDNDGLDEDTVVYPLIVTVEENIEHMGQFMGTLHESEEDEHGVNGIVDRKKMKILICEDSKVQLKKKAGNKIHFSSNGKAGYMDEAGNVIVQAKYDALCDFENGCSIVTINDKYGLIDETGKEIIPVEYDSLESDSESGFFEVEINERQGLIDKTGKIIVPVEYDGIYNYFAEKGFAKCWDDDNNIVYFDKHGNKRETEEEIKMYYKVYEQFTNRNRHF